MKREELGCINLFQPWADAVVIGKIPILIRSFKTNVRGTLGIASTEGMDGIVMNWLSEEELNIAEKYLAFGKAVGSVVVDDCIKVQSKNTWNVLTEMIGEEKMSFYPAYLLPKTQEVFFWKLSNPTKFKIPLPMISKGISWSHAKVDSKSMEPSLNSSFWRIFPEAKLISFNEIIRSNRDNNNS